ncbi:GL11680 [Drosophila persimilis]|uniref:GL11680 n=1 Tax=Drosophila persimilis TaxID=7234 RepID=B4IRV9_DROPE|nr:GL11680 [Drosophila persimilis]
MRQGMVWHHQTLHITWASGPAPCEAQPEAGARVWEESPRCSNSRDPRRRDPGPAPTTAAAEMATDGGGDVDCRGLRRRTAETRTAETATAAQTATAEAAATATTAPTAVEPAEVEASERGPWVWPAPERSTAAERPALKRQASCPGAPCRTEAAGPATAKLGTGSHGPLDGDPAGGVAGGGDPRANPASPGGEEGEKAGERAGYPVPHCDVGHPHGGVP